MRNQRKAVNQKVIFAGLFDDYDVNSNKLGSTVAKRNEKLVKLLNGVGEMNLGDVKDPALSMLLVTHMSIL